MINDNFFPLFIKEIYIFFQNSNQHTPSNMEICCFRSALKFWRLALSWNNRTTWQKKLKVKNSMSKLKQIHQLVKTPHVRSDKL